MNKFLEPDYDANNRYKKINEFIPSLADNLFILKISVTSKLHSLLTKSFWKFLNFLEVSSNGFNDKMKAILTERLSK